MNTSSVDIQSIQQAVKDFFQGQESIRLIYLFGSIMEKHFFPDSDVDVGIFYKHHDQLSFEQRLQEQEDLSSRLGREVDLMVLNMTSPVLYHQVLKYGKCIDPCDPRAPNEFFVRNLNKKFD